MKLTFWHGIIVAVVAILLFSMKSCRDGRLYQDEINKNRNYRDTIMQYQAKDGTVVDYNIALNTKLDAFLEVYGDSIQEYLENIKIPKPDVIIEYRDRFYIDSIPSVPLNISGCIFDTTFSIKDDYYKINGNISNKSLFIKDISIPNKSTIVIGDRKNKWWKKSEYIVTVKNSNPYLHSEGIQSFTFKEDKSRLSIGPSIGYGFYYDPWKGNVGHGIYGGVSLNYKIINWKKN